MNFELSTVQSCKTASETGLKLDVLRVSPSLDVDCAFTCVASKQPVRSHLIVGGPHKFQNRVCEITVLPENINNFREYKLHRVLPVVHVYG